MKKELFIHLLYSVSLVIILSVTKRWIGLEYWPFWLGAIAGTFMPDLDHFIYFYLLNPQEFTSQRIQLMIHQRQYPRVLDLLYVTRSERKQLIFHSGYFQIIFLVLFFWIMTSSGSFFGRGIVFAFFLHLLIDQAIDFQETGNLDNWFMKLNIQLSRDRQIVYFVVNCLLFVITAFIFS